VRTPVAVATTLLAALVWTIALVVDPGPFQDAPALLIGVGMLAMATVATVGMIVVGGRWAHLLGLACLAVTTVLALVRDFDVIWALATTATAVATLSLLSPIVTNTIRRLPSASGPPPRAVLPPLLLVSTPAILGLLGNDSAVWALAVVALSAPNFALFYIRVIPGGLIGIRLIWPVTSLALAPALGLPAGLGVAVAVISWDPSVRASYHPPREVGTTFRIPPELAPTEVLDAAEIDDTGRPR
jgi:hypothetical protein